MSSCKNCRNPNLTVDIETGNQVCPSCGVVQDFNNYEQQTFNADGPTGTNIRIGTSGSGYGYSYRETKIYLAQKIVSEILFKLDLESRIDEVNNMIKIITEEEYGTGNWFTVLVGACIYVVMRKANKPLPLIRVCNCICCDVYELGRMVNRVVDHLDLRLPEFDIVELFIRVFREWIAGRGNIEKDKVERMIKQGIFLVNCMIKWFVTTGRRPVPVVVAVIVFVCELNEVEICIDDLANDLNVAIVTCKLRYKELLKRLIEVARDNLPWGQDVNVKNIMKNAHIVIQYMEKKAMCKDSKENKNLEEVNVDLDSLVFDCLKKQDDYETEKSNDLKIDDLQKLDVSEKCLSKIYMEYLDECSNFKSSKEGVEGNRMTINGRKSSNFYVDLTEHWSGESELSKKLFLKKILEKNVGLNAMPPSFVNKCLEIERRREKIKAAKMRIERIRRPQVNGFNEKEAVCVKKSVNLSKRKRGGLKVDIDWEDLVIETLLLHEVKEEEIEKGYYNTLLDLHVFNSGFKRYTLSM